MEKTIKIGKIKSEFVPEESEFIKNLRDDYRRQRKVKNRLLVDEAAEVLATSIFEAVTQHVATLYAHLETDVSLDGYDVNQKLRVNQSLNIIEVYYQLLILTCLLNHHWQPHHVAFDIGNMVEEAISLGKKSKKGSDMIIGLKIQELWQTIIKEVSPKGVLSYGTKPLIKGFAKLLGWNHYYPDNLIE